MEKKEKETFHLYITFSTLHICHYMKICKHNEINITNMQMSSIILLYDYSQTFNKITIFTYFFMIPLHFKNINKF